MAPPAVKQPSRLPVRLPPGLGADEAVEIIGGIMRFVQGLQLATTGLAPLLAWIQRRSEEDAESAGVAGRAPSPPPATPELEALELETWDGWAE
jgi:hypothetical protein